MMRVMKKAPAFLPAMLFALLMVFAMVPLTAGTVHAEVYNLWVGETRVTSENQSGDGWDYDPDTCTLTLENARIENAHSYKTGEDASIYSIGIDLTIEVKDTNTIGTEDVSCGIYAENGSLTIKGSGTLNVKGMLYAIKTGKDLIIPTDTSVKVSSNLTEGIDQAIFAEKNIKISSGTVNITARYGQAIFARQEVTISGGTVTAASNGCDGVENLGIIQGTDMNISGGTVDAAVNGDYGNEIAILGNSVVNISDGTVVAAAEGKNSCAIRCGSSSSEGRSCDISGGTITAAARGDGAIGIDLEYARNSLIGRTAKLTSTGTGAAIRGRIDIYIPGTGWTDVEGTGEGTEITGADMGYDLSGYKKVRFPLVKRTVTFRVVNGSWNDGTVADKSVTLKGYGNDVLKLADSDIPEVGSKPDDGYKVGSWDVTPSTETAITGNTTYKYTYALKDYTVTVNSGTGGGVYTKGETVTITANDPEEGKQFKEWTGDVDKVEFTEGSKTTSSAKFNMPTEDLTFEATYEDIPVKAAMPTGKTLIYNGKSQTGVDAGTGYKLSGTASATNAGSYQATATLEEGYIWADGTKESKTIDWTINKAVAKVTAPAGKTFTYNGTAKTGVAAGSKYTLTGTTKATKAGTYTVKATLKTNTNYTYKWTDGKTAAKTIKWTINKAANTFRIKARTATVKYSAVKAKTQVLGVTKVITFTNKGQGAKTYAKVGGNKKITINKTTGKVTVAKGLKKGTYKVKVKAKAAGSANYKASPWKTVTFTIKVK